MSDYYVKSHPPVIDITICPQCQGDITQDIFHTRKGQKGRFIEAKACDRCKIIYVVLDD